MRSPALALALASLLSSTAGAVVGGDEPPLVTAGKAQRTHRIVDVASRDRMLTANLAGWRAQLDRDTGVPLRMWGDGPLVPGSVANAAIAESAARAFLAQHLSLLAPGSSATDFVLISNRESNGIRSLGFEQRANGLRVVGGAISFGFQADRLAIVGSTAIPHVRAPRDASWTRTAALVAARQWLATAGYAARERSSSAEPAVIYPVVRPRNARGFDISFHLAHELAVEDPAERQAWHVWVDATTGQPIARKSTVSRGTGKVTYKVPERTAQGTRSAFPAALATVLAGASNVTSDLEGNVTFAGNGPVNVTLGLTGPLVQVQNAQGASFAATQSLANGGTIEFSSAAEFDDAQLTAFIHANRVKQLAKRIDPNLAYLDQTLLISVNEADVCNAFSTGDDLHFFSAGSTNGITCENTARIADVVYHEFGHSWHTNTVIPGVGEFDGAVSEGISDVTAFLLTNDHRMAPGFFSDKPDEPLRNLDPTEFDKRFPIDATGEVHDDGELIAETLFDLDRNLRAKLGDGPGRAQLEKIFIGILQRSTGLASTYAEALLADDNDGNLGNGTPNKCEIDQAFAAHGLADETVTLDVGAPERTGFTITAPEAVAFTGGCAANALSVASVSVEWQLRGDQALQRVELTKDGTNFTGAIPTATSGSVIRYRVIYTLNNGTFVRFPAGNPADPFFEFYVGATRTIQCFDFESGAQGWTLGDQWEVGAPQGLGGDPDVAHGGTGVLGLDLTQDGLYDSASATFAESPEIDLAGATNVRLQYFRWLGVIDGFVDKAIITANGQSVFQNAELQPGALTLTNHTDREWRFTDIDLSSAVPTGKLKLKFSLEPNDQFFVPELGGWNIDDVCVVEVLAPACGDGFLDGAETCDDGNTVDGDGCSATCTTETPAPPDDGGCCSTGGSPVAPAGFAMLLGVGLLRRRRRSR